MTYLKNEMLSSFLSVSVIPTKVKVMAYLLKFAPPDNPELIDSTRAIARYFDCSVSSVTKAFKYLESKDIVTKVQNGVWHVNYDKFDVNITADR